MVIVSTVNFEGGILSEKSQVKLDFHGRHVYVFPFASLLLAVMSAFDDVYGRLSGFIG